MKILVVLLLVTVGCQEWKQVDVGQQKLDLLISNIKKDKGEELDGTVDIKKIFEKETLDDNWKHYFVVFDSQNNTSQYLDGVQVSDIYVGENKEQNGKQDIRFFAFVPPIPAISVPPQHPMVVERKVDYRVAPVLKDRLVQQNPSFMDYGVQQCYICGQQKSMVYQPDQAQQTGLLLADYVEGQDDGLLQYTAATTGRSGGRVGGRVGGGGGGSYRTGGRVGGSAFRSNERVGGNTFRSRASGSSYYRQAPQRNFNVYVQPNFGFGGYGFGGYPFGGGLGLGLGGLNLGFGLGVPFSPFYNPFLPSINLFPPIIFHNNFQQNYPREQTQFLGKDQTSQNIINNVVGQISSKDKNLRFNKVLSDDSFRVQNQDQIDILVLDFTDSKNNQVLYQAEVLEKPNQAPVVQQYQKLNQDETQQYLKYDSDLRDSKQKLTQITESLQNKVKGYIDSNGDLKYDKIEDLQCSDDGTLCEAVINYQDSKNHMDRVGVIFGNKDGNQNIINVEVLQDQKALI